MPPSLVPPSAGLPPKPHTSGSTSTNNINHSSSSSSSHAPDPPALAPPAVAPAAASTASPAPAPSAAASAGQQDPLSLILSGLQNLQTQVSSLHSRMDRMEETATTSSPYLAPQSDFAPPGSPLRFPLARPGIARSQSVSSGGADFMAPHLSLPSTLSQPAPLLASSPQLKLWCVVPAGGAGTRLWPLSRESYPKFLLDLTGAGRTLLQGTWDRLLPLAGQGRMMVVTGSAHALAVAHQLPDLDTKNLLTEPSPKESMAAIGLAAAVLYHRDPEAVLGSFAADHIVSGRDAFEAAVIEATAVAEQGYLVTIGIAPSHPSTGFGYIKLGKPLVGIEGAPNARVVADFVEKPDAKTASAYLKTGEYRWNGGMFVVKAKVLLDLLAHTKPELHEGLLKVGAAWDRSQEEKKAAFAEIWPKLEKIAIDHAVAEPAAKLGKVAVVPATFGWDDVGDFASLAGLIPAEKGEARVLGDHRLVITESQAGGIIVPAAGRPIACLGVDDVVVIDTPDALLVTTRARSQDVKKVVAHAKKLYPSLV